MTPLLRRQPRVLAFDLRPRSLAYVSLSLREVRGSAELVEQRISAALLKRVLQEQAPSAVSMWGAPGVRVPRWHDRPMVTPPRHLIPFAQVRELYPEAELFAPTARLRRLARLAATVLSRPQLPPRRYAKAPRPRPTRRVTRRA